MPANNFPEGYGEELIEASEGRILGIVRDPDTRETLAVAFAVTRAIEETHPELFGDTDSEEFQRLAHASRVAARRAIQHYAFFTDLAKQGVTEPDAEL